jgi:glucose-6-phosphate-specific signal transduction histidine kinase
MRQLLLQQLITTQEEERRHTARELHDQMGQDITALLLESKAIQNAVSADSSIARHVSQMQMLAMRMSDVVHTLALQLHPRNFGLPRRWRIICRNGLLMRGFRSTSTRPG